ncbi:MAG: 2'-5' RNA ligase family protein [Nitrospira sp.]|nr:2'-5' RNA ligase family protein [Nitrospira sp.]
MKRVPKPRKRLTGFLIEFRLHGYAKEYSKDLILDVARKFRVRGVTKNRAVPHITLYGPSETDDIRRVISQVVAVGQRYTLVPFNIKGFDYFDKEGKVIYLDIAPSPELEQLRWELAQSLSKISTSKSMDTKRRYAFHSTVAFKDIDKKFDKIWSYVKAREEPNINQYLLRITVLLRSRTILCEYDLVLKRLLNRREALSKYLWQETVGKLKGLQGLPQEQ